jgi:hypothetical protein
MKGTAGRNINVNFRLLQASAAALLLISTSAAAGSVEPAPAKPISGPWDAGKFTFASHEADTRKSLSGIACSAPKGTESTCLVVFDEGEEARFVAVGSDGYKIDNDPVVLGHSGKELDAESAATDGTYYYVSGSHSVNRKSCESNPASRRVIRFLVDPETGKAKREGAALAGFKDTDALWTLMASLPDFKDHVGERMCLGTEAPLNPVAPNLQGRQGVNIEGMTADKGKLHFGFRGPVKDGIAPILTVDAKGLFEGIDPQARVTMLHVGKGRGIRDLTRTESGIFVLAGPDDDRANDKSGWIVALWDGVPGATEVVQLDVRATLDLAGVVRPHCDKEIKPEAIMILPGPADKLEAVIMSDGMCDGGPLKFSVRPQ